MVRAHETAGETVLRSGCKINLFLDITGIRPDGRHDLFTLFWPLSEPHDCLRLSPRPHGLAVRCNAFDVDPAHNTLTSAWTRFADATGFAPGLDIVLEKGVPSGAGLGGGSADAAALLLWLNARAPSPLAADALAAVAEKVGADVPFFLRNRPALGRGVGEILQDFPDAALYRGLWLVLVRPPVAVSTAWAFQAFDRSLGPCGLSAMAENSAPDLTKTAAKDKNTNSRMIEPNCIRNSLETVVFAEYPRIAEAKMVLLRNGAAAAGMSGSGSSVFGLFREERTARAAPALFSGEFLAERGRAEGGGVWVQAL